MQYLLNEKKKTGKAHHWTGVDTFCRMYSSGGFIKGKYLLTWDLGGKDICHMCKMVRSKDEAMQLRRNTEKPRTDEQSGSVDM